MWSLLQYNGAWDALVATCDQSEQDALKMRVAQLQIHGNQAKYPVTESFGDGLHEVRARSGRVRVRLLFGFLPGRRIVFVWGGKKKGSSLPKEVIRRARILLAEAQAIEERLQDVIIH